MVLRVAHECGERGLVAGGGRPDDLLVVVHGGRRYGLENLGNQTARSARLLGMDCSEVREALSAGLDGETAPTDDAALIDARAQLCTTAGTSSRPRTT